MGLHLLHAGIAHFCWVQPCSSQQVSTHLQLWGCATSHCGLQKDCGVVFVSDSASPTGVDRFFLTLLPPKKSLDDPNSMEAQLAFKPADEQIVPLRQVGTVNLFQWCHPAATCHSAASTSHLCKALQADPAPAAGLCHASLSHLTQSASAV